VPVLLAVGVWINRPARKDSTSNATRNATKGATRNATQDHAAGSAHRHAPRKLAVPWFALGFLLCVGLNSVHVLPDTATHTLNLLDTFALTMAMTALGMETRIAQIREAGPRALMTGLILYVWLFAGGLGITWAVQRLFG
jgi:uncharacterized membrane protein YadS